MVSFLYFTINLFLSCLGAKTPKVTCTGPIRLVAIPTRMPTVHTTKTPGLIVEMLVTTSLQEMTMDIRRQNLVGKLEIPATIEVRTRREMTTPDTIAPVPNSATTMATQPTIEMGRVSSPEMKVVISTEEMTKAGPRNSQLWQQQSTFHLK